MTRATFKGDSELRLSQERAKYVMLGGSEVVVGTSIASYVNSRSMVHRPLPPRENSFYTSLQD